jgi:hypothetical protein
VIDNFVHYWQWQEREKDGITVTVKNVILSLSPARQTLTSFGF